jgi:hypothetical protein
MKKTPGKPQALRPSDAFYDYKVRLHFRIGPQMTYTQDVNIASDGEYQRLLVAIREKEPFHSDYLAIANTEDCRVFLVTLDNFEDKEAEKYRRRLTSRGQ